MSVADRTVRAWAISARLWREKPPALLGVGCFRWPDVVDTHLQGCTTALFPTRKAALAARLGLNYYAASRVVRVTVTIQMEAK